MSNLLKATAEEMRFAMFFGPNFRKPAALFYCQTEFAENMLHHQRILAVFVVPLSFPHLYKSHLPVQRDRRQVRLPHLKRDKRGACLPAVVQNLLHQHSSHPGAAQVRVDRDIQDMPLVQEQHRADIANEPTGMIERRERKSEGRAQFVDEMLAQPGMRERALLY